ncbi:unnamed protein product [Adineta ricciae]|uniref:Uncharacterized protein n=1 Tax=Adineta ricciae TaxID=249248 RepID=A0A815PP03_ADIRI|nr:unnamed protein product [Adineta ricciae]
MQLIQLFIFLSIFLDCYSRYLFYNTNNEHAFDCLYAHIQYYDVVKNGAYLTLHHLFPYCQRLDKSETSAIFVLEENVKNRISFQELSRNGITSSQLLDWFVPLDIAEEYAINGENPDKFIYNCSSPWFGSACQYQLINDEQIPFGRLVRLTFLQRESPSLDLDFPHGTCYPFLESCIRGPSPICLDWREICDGVYDCVHGEDEEFCYLLEQNHCSEDEFQCRRSKECISQTFVDDYETSFDCLDATDETGYSSRGFGDSCMRFPTFECEEMCREADRSFPCGDGQMALYLTPHFTSTCGNLREQYMTIALFTSFDYISNSACRQRLICLVRPDKIEFLIHSQDQIRCQLPLDYCPLEWLVFPEYPILYSLFQFVYLTNRSISLSTNDITPDFICFNASRCPKYLFCSVDIGMKNGHHCCHTSSMTHGEIDIWGEFPFIFGSIFEDCSEIARDKEFLLTAEETNSSININNQWITLHKTYPFPYICDSHDHILDDDETDETDCHLWPCNNPYTRCNQRFQCLNGIDEINCSYSLCASNEIRCDDSNSSYCLPVSHLADDYTQFDPYRPYRLIHLINETIGDLENYLFWNQTRCITIEYSDQNRLISLVGNNDDPCVIPRYPTSLTSYKIIVSRNETKLCTSGPILMDIFYKQSPYLRSSRLGYFPSVIPQASYRSTEIQSSQPTLFDLRSDDFVNWYCNRGFLIFYQNNQTTKCLCPPSYFGSRCQWQSQRVSLTLQLKYFTFTYEMPIFQIISMLIDDRGQISPYDEQAIHLPKRDCGTKYHVYLLYPSRPKDSSLNYSIRIDIFNRITLTHWASWLLPIPFPFIPVNRVAAQLLIPFNYQQTALSCPLSCGKHGKCLKYVNTNFSYFCQCDSGYSGSNCQFNHNCSCSSDSFCLSSSICICPLYKFGSKCYLKHTSCQSSTNPCENDGQCVPIDDRISMNNFTCICKEGFFGDRCENIQNRIDIQFDDRTLTRGKPVLIHFITIHDKTDHVQSTVLKQIKYGQNQVTILTAMPFHLVFVELLQGDFYLTVKREESIKSEHIRTNLRSNHQCMLIDQLLNETLKSFHYLRRVKFYPFFCRQNKDLMCFYDELYVCACDEDRFSNCFSFNRNVTYNCDQSENPCENNGKCFRANQTCSSSIRCFCSGCFYGTKCEFTTEGFVLSLDYILSYHIKPNLSIFHQPFIVKMSVAIVTMVSFTGLIGGLLAIVTFRTKEIQINGCGFYLFASGWISVIIPSVLVIKFIQLNLLQTKIYRNLSIFRLNCVLLDVVIKVLLASNDWLDGCVSIERVFTVKQGVKFDKTKSKQVAKWVILFILLFTTLTHLHDPLHRQLVEDVDVDEQRIWCISRYSSSINSYNSFITLFHFLVPFAINLISTVIIIISIARNRSTIQTRLSYLEHLKLQLKEHKHHFIASFTLILLGLPRLVISFISGCMKSPSNSWLFLSGYFVSFLPSMMTFVVYVLPSRTYKDQFDNVVEKTLRRFGR